MKTLDILINARSLIRDEIRWNKESLSRSETGRSVEPSNPCAVSWCAIGALHKVAAKNAMYLSSAEDALDEAAKLLYSRRAWLVNDMMGHNAVMRVYSSAIRKLQLQGK